MIVRTVAGVAVALAFLSGRGSAQEARPEPVSIGEWLQTLPQQGNALNPQFNSKDGSIRVDLRALGADRTLVLVNGRRVVPGGGGADGSVDLTSIPSHVIERVEVLHGGASAAYGSGAVAGVVNIVTKKDLGGTSASAYAGTSGQGDGTVYDVNVTSGVSGGKGSLLFSVGYYSQDPVSAADRDWSRTLSSYDYRTGVAQPISMSSAIPAGRFALDPDPAAGCTTPACAALFAAYGAGTKSFVVDPAGPGGFRLYGFDLAGDPVEDGYNFQTERHRVAPQERVSAFAIGETPLGEVGSAYLEACYVNRRSEMQIAPEPIFTVTLGESLDAASHYNPFGVELPDVRRRLVDLGNRTTTQNVDTFRAVAGVRGALPEAAGPLAGFSWDLSLSYGRTQAVDASRGSLRLPNLAGALGPSFLDPSDDVVKCGTPGSPIAGCTPLDILAAGSIDRAQLAAITFEGADRGTNQLLTWAVNVGGDLFSIGGAGPLAIWAGAERWTLSGTRIPDPITAALESSGGGFAPVRGSYDATEVYGELSVPIAAKWRWADELSASLAARYAHHSTSGGETAYTVGAFWRIVRDVALRARYATAFRAPTIAELFEGPTEYYPFVTDPCSGFPTPIPPGDPLFAACGAAANNGSFQQKAIARWGGNAGLRPETARTVGLGAVIEPRFAKGLSFTLDLYSIEIEDAVSTLGTETILQGCYFEGGAWCDRIHRDPSTQTITSMDDTLANAGGVRTSGLDWAARYDLATGFGRFRFVLDGTWLREHERELPDGTTFDAAGTYDLFAAPRWKVNAGVGWAWKGFGAGLFNRYVGSFEECANAIGTFGPDGQCHVDQTARLGVPRIARTVEGWSQLDAHVSWARAVGAGRTTVTLGVRNVLDDNPRVVFNGIEATSDPATYDFVGRFVFARLEWAY